MSNHKEKTWFSGEREHEGFPLQLRFPEKPDFETLQKKFPKRLIVTHQLKQVCKSGMPEPDYNRTLADFDHEMIIALEKVGMGLTVLVETYAGCRNYYMYASTSAPIDQVKSEFAQRYPQHDLEWELDDDPTWKLIRNYSRDYEFYKEDRR